MAKKPFPFSVCEKCCNAGGGTGGGDLIIDTEMSDTSENAVQNKVIKLYVDGITGDIEAGLDNIIAIQNSLIGGGSV